jgi:hypothetical protein
MNTLDLVTSLVAGAMMVALAVIFIRRKLHHRLSFFFAYLLFGPLATALRLSALHKPFLYYVVYWTTEFIYGLLALRAITQVFESVLRLFGFEGLGWRILLPLGTVIITAISIWQALYHPVGRGPLVRLAAGAYSFGFSVRCLQAGIFVLCLAPRRHYGVLWHYDFGVVAGLGLASFMTLLADLSRMWLGTSVETIFRYLPPAAYIGAALYWLFVFARPEPPRPQLTMTIDEQLTLVRRIMAMLKRYWDTFDYLPLVQK